MKFGTDIHKVYIMFNELNGVNTQRNDTCSHKAGLVWARDMHMLHMHGSSNLAPSHVMVKLAAARKNQALKSQQNNLKQGCQRVIHKCS